MKQDLFSNSDGYSGAKFSISLKSNPQNEEKTKEIPGGRGGRTKYFEVELALKNFKVSIRNRYNTTSNI